MPSENNVAIEIEGELWQISLVMSSNRLDQGKIRAELHQGNLPALACIGTLLVLP